MMRNAINALCCVFFPSDDNYTKMKRKPPYGAKNSQNPQFDKTCKDCAHSYGWCSKALDGHLILCRCPLDAKTEHGKWCKFLKDRACGQFIQRKDDSNAE